MQSSARVLRENIVSSLYIFLAFSFIRNALARASTPGFVVQIRICGHETLAALELNLNQNFFFLNVNVPNRHEIKFKKR